MLNKRFLKARNDAKYSGKNLTASWCYIIPFIYFLDFKKNIQTTPLAL